jgi:hypothetical protein
MSSSHTFLRYTRLVHLYFGVFISPALMFFAFTGALQTFSLHETTRGSDYKPPAWAVTLGQIHKKQTPVVNKKPAPPAQASDAGAGKPRHHDDTPNSAPPATAPSAPAAALAKPHNPLPLKIFFLIVAIGLFTSTLSGIYMSYKYVRNRMLVTSLLLAGIVIPVLMVLI